MTTYYYPSNYGVAEFNPDATASGASTITGNYQSPAGSYTVITDIPNTSPQQYTITTDYTGPGTGQTFTVTQTPYSDANHNETFGNVPDVGPAYFLLTNGEIPADDSYTFTGPSTPFQPTGGTTTDPVCFAAGTCIRVLRDNAMVDVAVENLVVGDLAVTSAGALRPVRWLGHRVTRCAGHPKPAHVNPVSIAAQAFGPDRPARDLVVSPGHALCFDVGGEVLIPAFALVNGTTIVQLDVETVTYWHVELDEHDILLAENLPAESYIEMGNRGFFAEAEAVTLRAQPDAPVATHADFCRPYVDCGPRLYAVKALLARQNKCFEQEQDDASAAA